MYVVESGKQLYRESHVSASRNLRVPPLEQVSDAVSQAPIVCTVQYVPAPDEPPVIPDKIIFNGVEYVKKTDDGR